MVLLLATYVISLQEYYKVPSLVYYYSLFLLMICITLRALRIICVANYRDPTEPLFKLKCILPISNLIKFNTFKFMFDYRNDYLPTIFHGTWQSCISQRYRNDFRLSHANNMRLKNHHPFYLPQFMELNRQDTLL